MMADRNINVKRVLLMSDSDAQCDDLNHFDLGVKTDVLGILCLPNEDFGRGYNTWNMRFRCPFLWCEYLIWATNHWKSIKNPHFIFCSSFQNLRLGSINFGYYSLKSASKILSGIVQASCRLYAPQPVGNNIYSSIPEIQHIALTSQLLRRVCMRVMIIV